MHSNDIDQFDDIKEAQTKEKIPLSFHIQGPVIKLSKALSGMANGYKRLFNMAPTDLKAMYLKQARTMNRKGDTQKCIGFLENIVRIDNRDIEILYKLGVAYEKNKQIEPALKAYQRVISLKPDYAKAHYRKALLLIRKQDYKDALTALEKAVEIKSDSAELYFRLGQVNDRLKEFQKAIDYFNKAVKINPDFLAVYKNMALTYDSMDDHKKSLKCLKRALEIEDID